MNSIENQTPEMQAQLERFMKDTSSESGEHNTTADVPVVEETAPEVTKEVTARKRQRGVRIENQQNNPVLYQLFQNAGIPTPEDVNRQKWEDLENMYQSIATALVTQADEINRCVSQMRMFGVTSSAEIALLVRNCSSDLGVFTARLVEIHKNHEGLTGFVKDGEDLARALEYFNSYTELFDQFRAVSFPSMLMMTEHLTNIAVDFKKKQEQEQAQNPNVVTDVQFVEKNN